MIRSDMDIREVLFAFSRSAHEFSSNHRGGYESFSPGYVEGMNHYVSLRNGPLPGFENSRSLFFFFNAQGTLPHTIVQVDKHNDLDAKQQETEYNYVDTGNIQYVISIFNIDYGGVNDCSVLNPDIINYCHTPFPPQMTHYELLSYPQIHIIVKH